MRFAIHISRRGDSRIAHTYLPEGDLRIAHPFKGGIASQIPKVLEGRLSHNSIGPNSRTAESAAGRGPGGRRIQQADGLVRGVIGGGQCSVETFQRGEIVLNGSGG